MLRILFLLLVVITGGCADYASSIDVSVDPEINLQIFKVAASAVGAYNIGTPIEKIDLETEQIYQSNGGATLRVVSDEGLLVFSIELTSAPTAQSEDVTLSYSGVGQDVVESYCVSTVNCEDGKIWLWDAEAEVGFVVLAW